MSSFSHLVRARALRRLLANGAFWGAYGQLIVVSGPIFTGFALWMGLAPADIALVASIVALAGLVQPFSFFMAARVRNQKTYVLIFGLVEVTLMASVVVVPLLTDALGPRFVMTAVAALSGTMMGNLAAPVFNAWFSTVLPEEARARVMGRRLIFVNLAAMAAGYGAGQFIDLTGASYVAFLAPFVLAWVVGVGGYLILIAVPFPAILRVEGAISLDRALTRPFKDLHFRRLLVFYLAWVFGVLVADPFYSVFMIRDLQVSYAAIGLLNSLVLGVGIMGYGLWGAVVGRFGSKPVLQILIVPRLILPLVWVLLRPDNYQVPLALIMISNGLVFSGLTVAINTLLFGSIPDGGDRAVYFATWAFATSVVSSVATGLGGVLVRVFEGFELTVLGIPVDNLRIVFVLSGLLLIVPVFLVRRVFETHAKPVVHLLGQVLRGNPISFVYNAFVFSRLRGSRSRARALRAMGKSRSPMAVDGLARAMHDLDPSIREEAVKGLGQTRSADAVDPLARALADEESDVRAEAAASLGRLRHQRGIEPLLVALDSMDSRVAMSAARALGDIGGPEVRERLFDRLAAGAGKALLPSLIESLSRLEDMRVIEPALAALKQYNSHAVRLQLLNAVCRALGTRNTFYNLLSSDDYEVAEKLDQMLQTAKRRFRRLSHDERREAMALHAVLAKHLVEGAYSVMAHAAGDLADTLKLDDPLALAARKALDLFVVALDSGHAERPEIFSLVCLSVIVDSIV